MKEASHVMHVALDARMMGAENTRGIGRYIEETVRAMLQIDTSFRYTLVVRDLAVSPFVGHPRVEHVTTTIPWYSIREQLFFGKILERIGADLIHIPHWNVPLTLHARFVVTVHDLLLLHQAHSAKASTRGPMTRVIKHAAFRMVLEHVLNESRLIFVPTMCVAKDLEHTKNVPHSNILVTGEGVNLEKRGGPSHGPVFSSTRPFVLYVGSAYPHKRLDLLLQTWQACVLMYPEHELLIAGELDVFMQRYQAKNADLPDPERVRFLGSVADAELVELYASADALAFPSSHEGFGLPPLEALALGCPVIASDIPCLREVLPDTGVEWFRDGDLHGMIRALDVVLHDVSSAKRAALSAKNWIRIHHDWKQSAQRVLAGYRSSIEKQ